MPKTKSNNPKTSKKQNISNKNTSIGGNVTDSVVVVGDGNQTTFQKIINIFKGESESLDHRNRRVMVNHVDEFWVKGILEKSLHGMALLELGIKEDPSAVNYPWTIKKETTNETLPTGKSMLEIFKEIGLGRSLLILGAPGSGKTTTLLELTRQLIETARNDETEPIPVVFNLSSWTEKLSLANWLAKQLNIFYYVPKKTAQKFVTHNKMFLLLDSLDEVRADQREKCVNAINEFKNEHGLTSLAICCRIEEYQSIQKKLSLAGAITLQPLTSGQVDEYFDRVGDKLHSLRAILHKDSSFQSLSQSPLMLNIMSLAYQNAAIEYWNDPASLKDGTLYKLLFSTYIAQMFKRKVGTKRYDDEQVKKYLSWLAQNMQRHNHEIFLLEDIQPNWLSSRFWRCSYILVSRLIFGFLSGLLSGLILGLFGGIFGGLFLGVVYGSILGLFGGFILGPIFGIAIAFIDVLRFEWLRKRVEMSNPHIFLWLVINILVVGLIFGLFLGVHNGLIFGLLAGGVFGLRGSRQGPEKDIQSVETLRWSWRAAFTGWIIYGLVGGVVGLLIVLFFRSGLVLWFGINWWIFGSILVLIFGPIGAILHGLRPEIIETKPTPSQGIRLSIRNANFVGILVMLAFGLIFGLTYNVDNIGTLSWILRLKYELISDRFVFGFVLGVALGIMSALWYGWFDIIQHYLLRLILIIQRQTPNNYAQFLDYAVDHIFLQKVGGGYRFIHRLLLDHFADIYVEKENK